MRRVEVPSYPVTIFVAGADVRPICQAYCDEVGLCVTVTRTRYVYTGGAEDGWIIGLINYGRFPSEPEEIFARAEALALRLIECDGIESATIQAPNKTVWLSDREEDRDSRLMREAPRREARLGPKGESGGSRREIAPTTPDPSSNIDFHGGG